MQWSSIPPISQLIAIGAGTGDVLAQCLAVKADKVIVYEADASLAQQLTKQFAMNKTVKVKAQAVSHQTAKEVMYCFNLAQCNALAPATTLLAELFPGLKSLPEREVQTLTLAKELAVIKLHGQQNMLLLELPAQNLLLVKHLVEANLLQYFSHVILQHNEQPLYQSASPINELQHYLSDQGFELCETDESDADFPLMRFYRDAQSQQLKAVKLEADATRKQLAELTQQLDAAKHQAIVGKQQAEEQKTELSKRLEAAKHQAEQAKAELVKQLDAAKQQAEQAKADLTKQLEALKKQVAAEKLQTEQAKAELVKQLDAAKQQAEQAKADLTKQLEALKKQVAAEKLQTEQAKTELAKQLEATKQQLDDAKKQAVENKQQAEQIKAGHAEQIEQLRAAKAQLESQVVIYQQWQASQSQQFEDVQQKIVADMSKNLTNVVKQVESFIGLRDLLEFAQLPLNYHGWPISADIALYLAKKVMDESFDYIIEFGSGTSTLVFAKALRTKIQHNLKQGDCRVVSFEHSKTYLQKTLDDITTHQVESYVDLVYAPLVDVQFDATNYLYYSCEDKLAEISQALQGREGKILILVDGPPASTGYLARYPAIPLILKYLSRHQLHVVMDDYVREDEKKAAGKWSKLFEERGIAHTKELLSFEKNGFSWILNK
ncbi:hypothetical protein ORJ04_21030 [Rheinheimera baltica]|uniref:Uncharacterized protein n=1 Tax=Rheinheimera baltica TaxID=67576 RepID=A0ABT9I5Y7_9GAMM|nr:hypothetical protein [Rheinheimera baltica]MDP5138435.1 hypothetical protein [Rheinheimera baltica]